MVKVVILSLLGLSLAAPAVVASSPPLSVADARKEASWAWRIEGHPGVMRLLRPERRGRSVVCFRARYRPAPRMAPSVIEHYRVTVRRLPGDWWVTEYLRFNADQPIGTRDAAER